ncbi:hypothetical protein [Sodalis ligni]|jgi:hypothetical protein|uniref:Uncharacterized protein n=1 Tax=Sodalis ligni TaxID=2697027 RepID=A0A4R1NPI7_9GAMM|nr:hypothetical protein [Sodalis ligni]TCL06636.1 hypothetical protein EZJ58_4905 [Sodalis ligni]
MIPLHSLQTKIPVEPLRHDSVNLGDEADVSSSAESASRQLEWQFNENNALGQTELATEALKTCAINLDRQLDALNGELLATLRPHELNGAERLLASAENLLKNGEDAPLSTLVGTDEDTIAKHLRDQLQRQPSAEFMERGRTLLDCIGSVLANDFTLLSGNAARRTGNVIAVAARTGTIVALTTMLRQLLGFALEQNFHSLGKDASLTPRMVAGIASLLIGPGLNLAGAVRDERNGLATPASRISRTWMGLLSLGGLLIASAYDPVAVIGHKLAAIGPQMAAYTLARDLLQMFFPLHENGGTNATGMLCSGFMYGIAQLLLGEGMVNFAPQSGAEYLISEAGRLGEPMADWAAASAAMALIEPNHLHDLLRSAMNTAVEMFDELQRPALMRYFSTQQGTGAAQGEAEAAPEKEPLTAGTAAFASGAVTTLRSASDKNSSRSISAEPSSAGDKRRRSSSFNGPDQGREGVRIGLDRPRIGAGSWPTSGQLADSMLTTCAMRTSVFEAVVAIALTVSTALQKTRLEQTEQCHIVSALIGGLVMVGYPAFVCAHLTGSSSPDSLAPAADPGTSPDPVAIEKQG